MSRPISICATDQSLVAFVGELEPLMGDMLILMKKIGNKTGGELPNDIGALRGYVLQIGRLFRKFDTLARLGSAMPILVRLANRFDHMGAPAMADILDEAAVLSKWAQSTPQQQAVQQKQLLDQQQQLADRLLNIHTEMLNATRTFSNPATIPAGMKRLLDQVKELGFAANALKQSTTQAQTVSAAPTTVAPTTAAAVRELIALANRLDAEGHHVLADVADRAADLVNKFSDKRDKTEALLPIKPGHLSTLSTRYCPDHHGVQAVRIADRVYQCPIDGRMYDYEGGYVDYSGQRILGGNIANQTPSSTPYALPQRLFDSRQNIINTIN